AEEDVLAYMTFPKEHRAKLHSTDEIDKPFPSDCGNLLGRKLINSLGALRSA
ncbi:hypothetical protein EV129_1395, partial [Rhizobium azibense]